MTKQLNIDIIARDKTKQALTGVQGRLNQVKSSVFSLRGALVGLGAGAVIRSFVNVGKEVESLQVRFKFLFGSVEEGAIAFDSLTKFAARVPFSLDEISRASGNLAVVAKDAEDLNRVLEITGNVAAVTGLDFETTSSQIQRAFSGGIGAADLFRERGVRALLGFQAGAKVTAEETIKRFEELFSGDGQFANATKDLAQTLEGTISMIGDKYFKFQKDVAAGFFDELKGEFGDLNTFLEENEQQIKDIAEAIGKNFAGAITTTSDLIKGVAPAVKNVADALGTTINGFKSLPTFVQTSGLIAALLFGKKGAIAFGAVSFLVGQIHELIEASAELETQEGLLDALDKDKISPFTLELAEINKLIEATGEKEIHKVLDLGTTNTKYLKLHGTLKQVAAVMRMAESDAADYMARQQSLSKAIITTNDESQKQIDIVSELSKRHQTELQLYLQTLREKQEADKAYYDELDRRRKTDAQVAIGIGKVTAEDQLELLKKGRLSELEFERMSQERKKEILVGAGKDILGNLATFNKQAFRLNQALAIGDAIMSTAQGVAAGLKKGFPVGYIEAAITAARGAAQIAAIRSAPPPRALGGSVTAGQPYIVGEQGREMFVPNQSGTIVSNDNLNKGTVVNVSIMANDTQGFDDLLIKRRSTIINVINDALNSQGKEAIV